MQHVIAESCDGRPLTLISTCLAVGLPDEHQTSEAGIFAQDLFPYACHRYKEILLAHAQLFTSALYHQVKGLQDLSLQRLTQVLTRIDCRQACQCAVTSGIVSSGSYLFLAVSSSSPTPPSCPMKKLVS
jgi:hypothetical protein